VRGVARLRHVDRRERPVASRSYARTSCSSGGPRSASRRAPAARACRRGTRRKRSPPPDPHALSSSCLMARGSRSGHRPRPRPGPASPRQAGRAGRGRSRRRAALSQTKRTVAEPSPPPFRTSRCGRSPRRGGGELLVRRRQDQCRGPRSWPGRSCPMRAASRHGAERRGPRSTDVAWATGRSAARWG
jgi:hypothetical protein